LRALFSNGVGKFGWRTAANSQAGGRKPVGDGGVGCDSLNIG